MARNLALRNCRVLLQISQRQLAAMVGTHQPMISAFERGVYQPGPELAAKISQALGMPKNLLFTDADESGDQG